MKKVCFFISLIVVAFMFGCGTICPKNKSIPVSKKENTSIPEKNNNFNTLSKKESVIERGSEEKVCCVREEYKKGLKKIYVKWSPTCSVPWKPYDGSAAKFPCP